MSVTMPQAGDATLRRDMPVGRPAARASWRRSRWRSRSSGALWLAERGALLVVADLHLEKGSAYAARGQMLPPYDTRETLAAAGGRGRRATAPRTVVLLGDTFHDRRAEARSRAEDVAALRALPRGRDWSGWSATTTPSRRRRCRGDACDELALARHRAAPRAPRRRQPGRSSPATCTRPRKVRRRGARCAAAASSPDGGAA